MQLSLVRAYRTSPKAVFGIALNLALVGVMLGQESTPRADVANVDFEKSVLSILQAHCIDCHNDSMRMGHLVLETREQMLSAEVVATGDAAESLLIHLLHERRILRASGCIGLRELARPLQRSLPEISEQIQGNARLRGFPAAFW